MAEKISEVKPDKKATMPDKTEKPMAVSVKEPSDVQTVPGPETKVVQVKPESQPAKTPGTPKTEAKIDAKKEADPSKEFVDGIMAEMALKGASKKRLIKTLVEQYGMDKQKVMFRLKRALITERYAAAHAEAGH